MATFEDDSTPPTPPAIVAKLEQLGGAAGLQQDYVDALDEDWFDNLDGAVQSVDAFDSSDLPSDPGTQQLLGAVDDVITG